MARKKQSTFYVLSVATAVILFWRGVWGLMDLYIFPNNPMVSYLVSTIAGVFILIITHKLKEELL